ncbi:MAG: hypothetical protein ACXWOX_23115, partial [Ktedonobacteraceae bacterium]
MQTLLALFEAKHAGVAERTTASSIPLFCLLFGLLRQGDRTRSFVLWTAIRLHACVQIRSDYFSLIHPLSCQLCCQISSAFEWAELALEATLCCHFAVVPLHPTTALSPRGAL